MNIINKCTLQSLKKNKLRTFVTIIGIILSVAMFTAVTTLVVSIQQYMIDIAVDQNGSWYGTIAGLSVEDKKQLEQNKEVKTSIFLEEIGYAKIDGIQNKEKPYLYIMGADSDITTLLPIKLTNGAMPKKQGEILLPEHLSANGGVEYQIGDRLELEIGKRFNEEGQVLRQVNSFQEEGPEQLGELKSRTYKVVGFYKRLSFEAYSAPGYTALTIKENFSDSLYQTFFTTKHVKNVYHIGNVEESLEKKHISDVITLGDTTIYKIREENKFAEISSEYNKNLLRYVGVSNDSRFKAVLYSMAGILVGIIMLGSISLIYNTFSISISERTKQFGLLKSIGATKRQIRNSVFFEAFLLCIIGILAGLIAGIGGIGVTLYCLRDMFVKLIALDTTIVPTLTVTWQGVVIAIGIGILTVMISAYLPARRAMKMSAIEAIRQSRDIKLSTKKIKSPKWFYKLFGLEGMLAQKYFKRSKKRYRATVISLFFSIVLFVSTSSFCAYMTGSMNAMIEMMNYDIVYNEKAEKGTDDLEQEILEEKRKTLLQADGVDRCHYAVYQRRDGLFSKEQYTEEISGLSDKTKRNTTEQIRDEIQLAFLDDETFFSYLKKEQIEPLAYQNKENPTALLVNTFKVYHSDNNKYQIGKMLKPNVKQLKISVPKKREGYYGTVEFGNDGKFVYVYVKEDAGDSEEEPEGETVAITKKTQAEVTLNIGEDVSGRLPEGMDNNNANVVLIYPYSVRDTVLEKIQSDGFEDGGLWVNYTFQAENHAKAYQSISAVLKGKRATGNLGTLYDVAEDGEVNQAMLLVTEVFSYGFIILISLIAVANVFNTISTNIQLRRREFAMLKSVGMTQKGLLRMMNYECILYGMKSLIFGIPVAAGVTYLIYRGILEGLELSFFIPWSSVAVVTAGVFVVVFSTMLYAMNKLRKENVMEELRRESI